MYTTLTAPAAGSQIAVDQIAGVGNVGRTKLGFGAEGAIADISNANPLPVSDPALAQSIEALATSEDIAGVVAAVGAAAGLTDEELRAQAIAVAADALPLPDGAATAAGQDAIAAAIDALRAPDYEVVPANSAGEALGAAGAAGDILTVVTIIPATTAPGPVAIRDGNGAPITIFTGGADSVATLHPFAVNLGVASTAGGWSVITGANVSAIATGKFS